MVKARGTVDISGEDDVLMTPQEREQAEELAQLNEDEGGDLFAVIDDLRTAQGVFIICTRIDPAEKSGYCGKMPVSDFSLDKMRSMYGTGTFKVRIRGSKGFLPGGGTVKISELENTSANAGSTDLASLLALMDKRESERREKTSRLLELAIPGSLTVIAALLGKNSGPDIGTLIAALKPSPGPSLTDLTSALANMKTLTEGSGTRDPLDSILKVMEAVKNLSTGDGNNAGKEGGQSNWLDVVRDLVKEAVPAVKPLLENIAARQQQLQQVQQEQLRQAGPLQILAPVAPVAPMPVAPIAPLAPVSPALPIASEQPSTPVQSAETDMFMIFKPIINENLSRVAGWAKDDRNPQAYAEIFLDELPQMVANYLSPPDALKWLNHERWFEVVCEWKPELSAYRGWCDEFRHALIEIIADQIMETGIEEAKEVEGKESKNDA